MKLFLEHTDDLEVTDNLGWTPLTTAVNRNSKDNIQMLLKRGAKIDCDGLHGMDLIATTMSFNDLGRSILFFLFVVEFFRLDTVQMLMNYGARVTPSTDVDSSAKESNQCHLLHFAADDGLTNIARVLIEKGQIPVNTLDQSGWSPLHVAAGHNHLEIVQLLLRNGAEINIKVRYSLQPY